MDQMFFSVRVLYPDGPGSPPASDAMMTSEEFITWIDVLTSQPAWCRTPRQWQPRGIKLRLIPPAEWDEPDVPGMFPVAGLQVERLPFDAEPF